MSQQHFLHKGDLEPIIAAQAGNRAFRRNLERAVGDPRLLLKALGRYIQFNATFGGGVANLAGELAAQRTMFVDTAEPIRAIQDRSVEVASKIFSAAVDEFSDRGTGGRYSHRRLAQQTLRAAAEYYRIRPEELNDLVQLTPVLEGVMRDVAGGYLVNQGVGEEKLFNGMGFHTGSEVVADGEFNILNSVLQAELPDLVARLRNTPIEDDAPPLATAYYWVYIHTGVEAEHFDAALKGVNEAVRYYEGSARREQLRNWLLDGFKHFSAVQTVFMEHLLDEK